MHVFVTGATGFVGAAIVSDLLGAGHSVLGLARSDASAASLGALGAQVQRGSLEDLDSLRHGAAAADAVIHTAFDHDFTRFGASCTLDRQAILALGDGLAGSARPLLVTAGVGWLAPGRVATEADVAPVHSERFPRASELAAAELVARGVHAGVVRLPPSVHGAGDHGFVPVLIAIARERGVSAYIDGGNNHWPAVQRHDAARVYRLALEQGVTPGAVYHAVAEEGVPFGEIAALIGRRLALPVESRSGDAVAAHFGWFHMFAGMDAAASSALTRSRLDWTPTHAGLLDDMESAGYFD